MIHLSSVALWKSIRSSCSELFNKRNYFSALDCVSWKRLWSTSKDSEKKLCMKNQISKTQSENDIQTASKHKVFAHFFLFSLSHFLSLSQSRTLSFSLFIGYSQSLLKMTLSLIHFLSLSFVTWSCLFSFTSRLFCMKAQPWEKI